VDLSLIAASAAEPTTLETILSYAWIIGSVAAGLGFVIFVHELGHFLVAKACGVKCEKFYIGFDWFPIKKIGPITIPHSLFKRQWGETEYGIGILPLGGYVKMLGQDDDPRNAEAEAERSKLDPRSYQAKSVPARMAIISAGVIMNLIFGVLLATLAYGLGVPEMPAVIGGTVPGSPAWEKLEPGMKAIQFGKSSTPYEHHRFDDMKRRVVFNGDDRDLEILFRDESGKEDWFTLRPSGRTKAETDFPSLGFYPGRNRKLAVSPKNPRPVEGIEHDDVLVEMAGKKLEPDQNKFDSQVNALLAQHPSGPLKVVVLRAEKKEGSAKEIEESKQRVELTIAERRIRTVGLVMKIGPIVSIHQNSPAAKAGLLVGDVIEKVNGQPIGDPLSLGQRVIPKGESESFKFTISRKGAGGKPEKQDIVVEALPPQQYQDSFPYGGPTTIESIGVAFDVSNEIAAVEAGSTAEKEGLKAGDVVTAAQFIPASEEDRQKETSEGLLEKEFGKLIELDNNLRSWTRIHYSLQHVLPESKLELTLKRGKSVVKTTLTPADSKTFFDERRGLVFRPIEFWHQASGVSEAFALGFREIKERLGDVVMMLTQLVSRRISPKHLSGPAGIIQAAGYSAGHSIPMLLMFLVMLSANLAIINFLPIPVLDGGHMLFLAAEGIRRKPVPPHIQGWLSIGGLAFLLSLMLFATAMDVQRWFQ